MSKQNRLIKSRGKRFQSAAETLDERMRKKLTEANSWYKERAVTAEEEEREWDLWNWQPEEKEKALNTSKENWRKGSG